MMQSLSNSFAVRQCMGVILLIGGLTATAIAEDQSPYLGTFENDKLSISIRAVDDGFAGLVKRAGESLPLKATVKKNKLVGTFMRDGTSYAFSARMIRDDLELTLGLQTSNLRRQSEQSEFVGTFRAKDLSIVIRKSGRRFHGQFKQGKDSVDFLGLLDKGKLRGEFSKEEVKYFFTAALNRNKMKLTFGLHSYDLERVKGKTLAGDDQTPNTSRRRVLLADGKDIVTGSVLVSPDNRRVAYITQKDSRRRAVINGVAGKPYYLVNLWRFSPDSKRLAYIATIENQYSMVIDGREGERFDGFWFGPTPFSPNSKRTAYAGFQGRNWYMVVNGKKEVAAYERIVGVAFSPDSRRLVFGAQRDRKWSAVLDGETLGSYDAIGFGPQPFSSDSKKISYAFHASGRQYMSVGGEESKPFDIVTNGVFSSDGKHFAFNAVLKDQHHVITDGVKGPAFDQVGRMSFSRGSATPDYTARKGAQWRIVKNNVPGTPYAVVSPVVYSSDGSHMAYLARLGKDMLVIRDNQVEGEYTQIRNLSISSDGKKLAYAALGKESKWRVIAGDKISRPFNTLPRAITFTPDNAHVVYLVQRSNAWHLVVDGVEGEPIGEPLPGSLLVFDGPTKLRTVVREEGQFYRLDVEILNSSSKSVE